jgi:H+-translocating NAD(P) transhydrogenase subunit alpha
LTPAQLELQRQGMKKIIGAADVVITTAQVFGRPAPRIVTRDMVEGMRPGSVVVDMAVESGGNVEGSVLNEVLDLNGVLVVGLGNLPSQVSRNASEMYSSNIVNLLTEFWSADKKALNLVKSCVITRDGAIVNETIKKL